MNEKELLQQIENLQKENDALRLKQSNNGGNRPKYFLKLLKIVLYILLAVTCSFLIWYIFNTYFIISVKDSVTTDGFGRELFAVHGLLARCLSLGREEWTGYLYFFLDAVICWSAIGINYLLFKLIGKVNQKIKIE